MRIKSNTFDPTAYLNELESDYETSYEDIDQEKYYIKGRNKNKVDTSKIEEILKILRKHQHEYIKNLDENTKKVYKKFVSMARCLQGTEAYKVFYSIVYKCFKDEKGAKPGTLLAYFQGCMIKNGKKDVFCTNSCINGLKPPGNNRCEYKVFMTKLTDDNLYDFALVQDSDNEKAIVYISNCNSIKHFKGFSKEEIEKLQEHNVSKVKIKSTSDKHCEDIEITNDFIDLEKVKTDVTIKNNSDDNNNNTALIVVLIILILIILFIGWRIFCKNKTNYY